MKLRILFLAALFMPTSVWAHCYSKSGVSKRQACKGKGGVWIFAGKHNERAEQGVLIAKQHSCVDRARFKTRCKKSGGTLHKCKSGKKKSCFLESGTTKNGFSCRCGQGSGVVFSYAKSRCACTQKDKLYAPKQKACVCPKGKQQQGFKCVEVPTCPKGAVLIGKGPNCNCRDANKLFNKKTRSCDKQSWKSYKIQKGQGKKPRGRTVRGCSGHITLNGQVAIALKGLGASNKGKIMGGPMKARRAARDNIRACFEQMMRGKRGKPDRCKYTSGWKLFGGKAFHPTHLRKAACQQSKKKSKAKFLFGLKVFHPKGGSRNKNCRFSTGLGFIGPRHDGLSKQIWCR